MINKIGNQRYSSYCPFPQKVRKGSPKNICDEQRQSHAAAVLVRKESQIDVVKKRISALCVREQKYTHRTMNADMQMEKKEAIQRQNNKIQKLLDKQRKRENERLEIKKYRNLQTRAQKYFRSKLNREKRVKEAQEQSVLVRNKSKSNHSTISQQKADQLNQKQQKMRQIYQSQRKAQGERSRILLSRREEVRSREQKQLQHLNKLQEIKNYQLTELGKLELMMVQKNNTSRAALQASRDKLTSKNNHKYQTHQIIRTARNRKSSKHSISLHLY